MSELMYRDTPVVTLKDEKGVPSSIDKVVEPGLLPFSLLNKKELKFQDIQDWLEGRRIPKNREGVEEIRSQRPQILESYLCFSLDDSFWIRRRRFDNFDKNGFFNRQYDTGFGDMVFKSYKVNPYKVKQDTFPDVMTTGRLKKCWRQDKGRRSFLIKGGSAAFKNEPLSEVLSSVVLEKLDFIPYVRYDLCVEGIEICSACKNFISPGEELVTAKSILEADESGKGVDIYHRLLEVCKKHEIPKAKEYLDKLIFFDEIIGNTQRSLNDIAFIYETEKHRFKGPAPIFDNGDALMRHGAVTSLDAKSRLFSDVAGKIYAEQLSSLANGGNRGKNNGKVSSQLKDDTPQKKSLTDDSNHKRIISAYPYISRKTSEELTEVFEERLDIFKRPENIELDEKRKKRKSFAAVNLTSLTNINDDIKHRGEER